MWDRIQTMETRLDKTKGGDCQEIDKTDRSVEKWKKEFAITADKVS